MLDMCTRLKIVGSSVVTYFLANPIEEHWQVVNWIFMFKGTFRICLCFRSGKLVLNAYIDAEMTNDMNFKKCTFG